MKNTMRNLRQAVLDDLNEKLKGAIASRSDYDLGNVRGRLIAFALCEMITKPEYDAFHDRLDAAGFASVRILERKPGGPEERPQRPMRKVVVNTHSTPFFTLSDAAIARLAVAKGTSVDEMRLRDLERDDDDLVRAVEEMRAGVNGEYTRLRVVGIPNDVRWEIRGGGDRPEYVSEIGRAWHAE